MVKSYSELSFGERLKRVVAIGTLGALGTTGIAACGPASAEKVPGNTVPSASASKTPGSTESAPSTTKPESKPWTPAELEVKEPAFALSPEVQKLWDGSLADVLAATDTQRLTLGHAMITPEQLERNMKNNPYAEEFVPFLAAPTKSDDGTKIDTYDLIKTMQSGDSRVFHKSAGGLDSEFALKYLATSFYDPAHSANFAALQPIIRALDGGRGSSVSERINIQAEIAPEQKQIDGKPATVRVFQGNSTRVGDVEIRYAFIQDENGVGDFVVVDH